MLFTPLNPLVVQVKAVEDSGSAAPTVKQQQSPRPRSLSIHTKNGVEEQREDKTKEAITGIEVVEFTSENLVGAWEEFLSFIRPLSERHYQVLVSYRPEKVGEHAVKLEVRTDFEKEHLKALESKLVGYLHLKFADTKLELQSRVNPNLKVDISPKHMNEMDYLRYLVDEDDSLRKLVEVFNISVK